MIKALILMLVLALLWIALSGIFEPLPLMLGALSCLACVAVSSRMSIIDDEAVPTQIQLRILNYSVWIGFEIIKSNIAIAKLILARNPALAHHFIRVQSSQKTEFGKVLFANSITLTPGTVTVETADGALLVHAINHSAANEDALAAMDRRVTATEKR